MDKFGSDLKKTRINEPDRRIFYWRKASCSIGIIISAGLFLVGLFLYRRKNTGFSQGLAWPLFIISIILLMVCISIVIRSPKDIKRVNGYLENNKSMIYSDEIPRMEKVMLNFKYLKYAELILAGVSIGLYLIFNSEKLKGIALGVLTISIMMYLFDHMAEARGRKYVEYLNTIKNG